jgi:hypothetical protein
MLARYNVRWIVCWSTDAREYFEGMPDVATPSGTFEKFSLFRIVGDSTFFVKGSGAVETNLNSITVRDAGAEDGTIVLKYHYDAGLRVPAPMELFPFDVPGDPVPFIGVRNPERAFEITSSRR